ncbi:MAG: hypothetical protein ACRD3M_09815, partial [Thermoanaerobaculia bacterium]
MCKERLSDRNADRLRSLLVWIFLAAAWSSEATAATFTVINTNDAGSGSLRQAITDANGSPGYDAINFNAGAGVQEITLASPLPTIADGVTIEGPGTGGANRIVLDGGGNTYCLFFTTGDHTVDGVIINHCGTAIGAAGANSLTVTNNWIGTDALGVTTGDVALGLNIGGPIDLLVEGNLLAATNTDVNVANASNGVIADNFFNTNPAGLTANGNSTYGIALTNCDNNLVAFNVIGRTFAAVRIAGFENDVQNNFIGMNFGGTAALINSAYGVWIVNGSGNTIGGPGLENYIGGNQRGVFLQGAGAGGNSVFENFFGFGPGANQISNGWGIEVQSSNNLIYGTTIRYCNFDAINFTFPSTGTDIENVHLYDNFFGINIMPAGSNPNDPLDADGGPNDGQNWPVLSYARTSPTASACGGNLMSKPNTLYRIDVYQGTGCNTSGYGEGKDLHESLFVLTNGSGIANFDRSGPGLPVGTVL